MRDLPCTKPRCRGCTVTLAASASGRLRARAKYLLSVLDNDIGLVVLGERATRVMSLMSSPFGMKARLHSLNFSGSSSPWVKESYASCITS